MFNSGPNTINNNKKEVPNQFSVPSPHFLLSANKGVIGFSTGSDISHTSDDKSQDETHFIARIRCTFQYSFRTFQYSSIRKRCDVMFRFSILLLIPYGWISGTTSLFRGASKLKRDEPVEKEQSDFVNQYNICTFSQSA
uniref:Uncharacterized protein n=1 Tax=Glossina austeni TaxID=7395 RepID=A0A1A9VDY7_GLOAU